MLYTDLNELLDRYNVPGKDEDVLERVNELCKTVYSFGAGVALWGPAIDAARAFAHADAETVSKIIKDLYAAVLAAEKAGTDTKVWIQKWGQDLMSIHLSKKAAREFIQKESATADPELFDECPAPIGELYETNRQIPEEMRDSLFAHGSLWVRTNAQGFK